MKTKADKILQNSLLPDCGDIVPRLFTFANLLKHEGGSISAASLGDALERLARWSTPFELSKAIDKCERQLAEKIREYNRDKADIYNEVREEVEKELEKELNEAKREAKEANDWRDENEPVVEWAAEIPGDISDALSEYKIQEWNYSQVQKVADAVHSAGRGEW